MNLCVGDIVIIKDDNLSRNHWELASVTSVSEGKDGHVRSVKLERPAHKLVLLVRGDEVVKDEHSGSVPVEEPSSKDN